MAEMLPTVPTIVSLNAAGAKELSFKHRLRVARAEIHKACTKGLTEAELDFELDDAHCRTLEAEGYTVQVDKDTTISWET